MQDGAHSVRLPDVFYGAEESASARQSRYLGATRLRLVLAVAAGVLVGLAPLAEESEINGWALASAACFAGAFFVELWLRRVAPQQAWYEARALAESCKTLGWRYVVGGLPFGHAIPDADALFAERVRQLLDEETEPNLARRTQWQGQAIAPTPSMRFLREASLPRRRTAYLEQRVEDQRAWYEQKARWNAQLANRWEIALLVLETLGVILALATGMRWLQIDLASAISAGIGCGVAWLAVRQHQTLASTYASAASELAVAVDVVREASEEADWARAVADAEDAISREHTMWSAQRRGHLRQRGHDHPHLGAAAVEVRKAR